MQASIDDYFDCHDGGKACQLENEATQASVRYWTMGKGEVLKILAPLKEAPLKAMALAIDCTLSRDCT